MTFVTFDTYAAVKKLREAGMPEPQAEAQAALLAEALAAALEQFKADMRLHELATKGDLKELELKLDARSAELRQELETRLTELQLTTKQGLRELELKLEARSAELGRDIEAIKADLLKWVIGLLLAQTGLIAALVKLL